MAANPAPERASVVTSLPDHSELPQLDFDGWRAWFVAAARQVMRWTPDGGVAIFYQSDVRHRGAWVDKGYLVMRAAEEEGATLSWHKIVCRRPPGTVSLGRPSYSHMLCLSRAPLAPRQTGVVPEPGPDVLADAGAMTWSRAMGVSACEVACRFIQTRTTSRVIVDPFCGRGTVLAVAEASGFEVIGVDVSARRCKAARNLTVERRSEPA